MQLSHLWGNMQRTSSPVDFLLSPCALFRGVDEFGFALFLTKKTVSSTQQQYAPVMAENKPGNIRGRTTGEAEGITHLWS